MANTMEKVIITLVGIAAVNLGLIAVLGFDVIGKGLSYIPFTSAGMIVGIAIGLAGISVLYNTYK